ncbi:hypothetical protein LOZ66_002421 [Ophidiomyces ophidiicola]|nr:hypothetical protein LOZ66_002421 [Ophidiomyces ophidiicola]
MTSVRIRDLLKFPENGNNATDTVLNGIHFNLTALRHFNYTLYSNGTISNGSNCWLSFDKYKPAILSNGTFINATSCYFPIENIGTRGGVGIAFASLFAISIVFALIGLRKHGSTYLPLDKRWALVGRRWQWYWMIFVGICGTVSCFMSIDVDRSYLQSTAIILQSFFYYLAFPSVLAAIWEGVRNWGSWQERQVQDRDNFAFVAATTREKQEFYLPLIFYFFAFLNFFLTIPRSWTNIQKQRSFDQQETLARPTATDGRFKSASFVAIVCVLLICYSLGHSLYRYKSRPQGRVNVAYYIAVTPLKFTLTIPIAALRIGFGIVSVFEWTISPLKYNGNPGWIYGFGYTPILLILTIFNIYGYLDPNEDQDLIRQRIERGRSADDELGVDRKSKKPHWWHRSRPDFTVGPTGTDLDSRFRCLVPQVGGGAATQQNIQKNIEMGVLDPNKYKDLEVPNQGSSSKVLLNQPGWPQKNNPVAGAKKEEVDMKITQSNVDDTLDPEAKTGSKISRSNSATTAFSGETLTSPTRTQKVRSMLDI